MLNMVEFFSNKKTTVCHLSSYDCLSLRLGACFCACLAVRTKQEFRLLNIVVRSVLFHASNSRSGWAHGVGA